ncbi:AAA family ATPase [Candidatus Poribacteria bacterium]|nr:AAA family ATPase [Candidatus Poribacteria bacterium]
MKNSTFITKVTLRNYKSIASCEVQLRPLMFLVGPNGAGKSNFLDSLRFVADALNSSLDHAIRDRGGINDVRRRSGGHPNHFSIRLDFILPDGATGHYAFRISARPPGEYEVQREECRLWSAQFPTQEEYFHVKNGTVDEKSVGVAPAATKDRLYLVNASGLEEFRPVYEAFSQMGFYSLNPDKIRDLQSPDPGDLLIRDGSNLASVLAQLSPSVKERIEKYLAAVVPGVHAVEVREIGPKETLEFRQGVAGAKHPWRFLANNMSDGTLRVLGILVALFQENRDPQKRVLLVGIEEPEIALHPAAAEVLLDGLRDAANNTQIILTSHSPDLLDDKDLDPDSILAVEARNGNTVIAGIDEAGRSAVHDRLYTTGELLRIDQLQPDPVSIDAAKTKQLHLFDFEKGNLSRSKKKDRNK